MVNSENAAWREVDDEVVILNAATTCYYSLNDTGTFIWRLLLDNHSTLDALEANLASRHDLSSDRVRGDVASFITQLETENLLVAEVLDSAGSVLAMDDGSEARQTSSPYEAPNLKKYDTLDQLIVSAE